MSEVKHIDPKIKKGHKDFSKYTNEERLKLVDEGWEPMSASQIKKLKKENLKITKQKKDKARRRELKKINKKNR